MTMKALKYNVYKILGKDREIWPVTVWKKVRRGDSMENGQWETDRARRTKNPKTGEEEYQFLKTGEITDSISYKHLTQGPGGHPLLIAAEPEKGVVLPAKEDWELEEGEEGPDNVDMGWVMDQSHFIKVGKNELERSYDIVRTDESAWWQEDKLQAAFLFVGAGVFFMLLGISYSKVISEGAVQDLTQLAKQAQTAAKSVLPFIAWKIKDRK